MNIFKKVIKFNFFKATIIFMVILMIIGFVVEIVSIKTAPEYYMHVPYVVYPAHLMARALEAIRETMIPKSESNMRFYSSSLGIMSSVSVLYNFYYYFLVYFIYRIFKKYLFKNKEMINIKFINKFKKVIKFSFGRVIIATALVVIPAFIIKVLVESIPVDATSSMETAEIAYKYIAYVSIPQYPIKLAKRTLTSTCKLVAPPSDDIFRCYGLIIK
ncbi:MAG: hypothetical protein ABIC82_00385 [bacterium]